MSSLTNSLLVVVAARRLLPAELGGLAIAMSLAMLLLGLARTVTSQPLTIVYSGAAPDAQRGPVGQAVATGLTLSVPLGAGVVLLGAVLGGAAGPALVVVGCGLPLLITQDTLRYAFFAIGNPGGAVASDLAWLAVVVAMLVAGDAASAPTLVAWWIAGATVGAAIGGSKLRTQFVVRAGPWRVRRWLSEHRSLSAGLLADSLLVSSFGQAMPALLGLIVSVEASGSYRVAQTAIGPLATITAGMAIQMLPELVRETSGALRRPMAMSLSSKLTVLALAYTAVLLVAPTNVMGWLFGDAWPDARSTALVLGLAAAGGALMQGALLLLRAAAKPQPIARFRLVVLPVQVVLTCGLALFWGALGAAVGLALVNWLSSPLWWRLADRLLSLSSSPRHRASQLRGR